MEAFIVAVNNVNFEEGEAAVGYAKIYFSREEAQEKQDAVETEYNKDNQQGDVPYNVDVTVYKLRDIALISKLEFGSDEDGLVVRCSGEGLNTLESYTLENNASVDDYGDEE